MRADQVFDQFKREVELNPTKGHNKLLVRAFELVKEEIIASNYSIQSVRLAHAIFGYLGDKGLDERVKLMRKYLQVSMNASNEDKFWANWELIDNLALLKRYKEMIPDQRLFLQWTRDNMSVEWCIKVMFDSTQAIGWFYEGITDEWFDIYFELINKIEPTEQNRHNRVLYVETAAGLFVYQLKKYDRALKEIERYKQILNEDQTWDEFNEFFIRRIPYLLEVHSGTGNEEKYDQVASEVIEKIELFIQQFKQGQPINVLEICDMAHEIGTSLMWEKRYDQARALFEFALEYQGAGVTHFFYAICVWATQKNRVKAIYHLKIAENEVMGNGGLRSRYIHMFLEQPEFEDVHEDHEFLSIYKR